MSPSLLIVFLFSLAVVTCSKLVYLEKPTDSDAVHFVIKFSQSHDVRGDHGEFILVADHNNFFPENEVIFSNFSDISHSYYVAEPALLANVPVSDLPSSFLEFEHKLFLNVGRFVFAVPKDKEDAFVSAIPYDYEFVLVSSTPVSFFEKYISQEKFIYFFDYYELPGPSMDSFTSQEPDPNIVDLIEGVNSVDLKNFVTYLSGESSSLITRQAQSSGAISAQQYLQLQFTNITFGFEVETQSFRTGYSSNVLATLTGTSEPKKLVLVTAHYDDRGPTLSSTTDRAPGANDNGSGTGALLQIAKLISKNKVSFAYTVVLIAFSGEEQGLYGSAYCAQQYKNAGANIVAVLNADMIAYRVPSESPQLAFVSRSSTLSLNSLLSNITRTYVTGLTVGTSTGCCTDHSSFYNQGFPATSYFERNGGIADPQYHKSGDLVNRVGYDIDLQYPLIVKSIFAGLLTVAQYNSV